MSNTDVLASVTYEAETAGAFNPSAGTGWGENVNTYATHRIPIIEVPDVSGLTQAKNAASFTEQYRGAGHAYFKGVMGGSFKTKMWLAGHGATTAGSPTVDAVETFLGYVFGGTGAFSLATSQTATGGTAAVPTMSGATGVTAGGLVRIGTLGDGDGDGEFYAVATHASSNLTLLNALRGAPANGAVVYPAWMLFSNSSPTASAVNGLRFEILTANTQYRCHGCFPMNVTIAGTNPNESPTIEIEWGVSWWTDAASTTFPSTVTSNRYLPAPNAGGALHVNAVGTVTNNEWACRSFTLNINLGIEALESPGGANAYQSITGAVRTGNESWSIEFVVDSQAAGTTTFADWARAETNLSVMYTLSPTLARAVGFWFPKVCLTSVPVQNRIGNINRITVRGTCHTSDTLTSEITRARGIIGLA